ncbi:MAG: AraC family transcriptional regulator [Lyngbya sp. HA4199-MV5]|nr:AraC family transcriptional regulator [Lyngbya sp. HA4199-MV5]
MMAQHRLSIDSTAENALLQILPHQPLYSSHQQGWQGVKVEHHYQPAHETPEHTHEQHVLVVLTRCDPLKVERRLNGNFHSSLMTSGEAFLLPAQAHHQVWIHGEADYAFLAVEPELINRTADAMEVDRVELVPQHQIHDPLIHGIGLALLSELTSDQVCDRLYVEAAINLLTMHLLQRYSTRKPTIQKKQEGLANTKLQQVVEYINTHLTESLSLPEMAQAIGMSQYHFLRQFKQSTGLTPWQFVAQCRLKLAKQLLTERKLSIGEISDRLGFANQQQLTKFFRKCTGITPRDYQKLL